jgi:hypothetical protein
LNRLQLRGEAELLAEIAHALEDPSRVVSPRAIVRSRLLITDCGSPLNCSTHQDELHQALELILADLSSATNPAEHEPQQLPRRRDAGTQQRSQARRTPANADTCVTGPPSPSGKTSANSPSNTVVVP